MASKKNIARFALTAAAMTAGLAQMGGSQPVHEEEQAPFVHVGTTVRTAYQQIPLGYYRDAGANMQFVVNDGREADKHLSVNFRIADDDLSRVRLFNGLKLVYEESLDDIVGTVYGRIDYDDDHSGFHLFRLEAEDASDNTTRIVFATYNNKILTGTFPKDEQQPYIFFADKDDTWHENLKGNGYVGLVMVSDKTPYLLEDNESWRPPMYGFSSRVFDEDLDTLELEVNGSKVFERKFEDRELGGRQVRNPAEVHIIYVVPKNGETYEIKVTATDSEGRVTVEERTVTVPE